MENKKSYNFLLYIFFYRQETSAETKARKLRTNAQLQAAAEKKMLPMKSILLRVTWKLIRWTQAN